MSETPPSNSFKKYFPLLTTICCLICAVIFIGINLEEKVDSWDAYRKWGLLPATDIFNGGYWTLITSNFFHTELWHIVFNLYWFWIFGKKIEFESNKIYYGAIIFTSALVSSSAQLAFSDSTGIGFSGIGYSLFGFILIKDKTSENYKNYLDKKTINLFLFWLALCVILTKTKAWSIGNAAHIAGFLWGVTLAYITKFDKAKQSIIGLSFLAITISSIFWSPFSTAWLSFQASEFHVNQKYDEAIELYKKILSRNSDNEFAKTNLQQLEIYKLQEKATAFHKEHKYKEAFEIYNQILKIDKENKWAKESLETLK